MTKKKPNIKAIILAGGKGNRLSPITDRIPKSLVSLVNGKPILGYQIESLLRNNIKEIVICVGYKPKSIIKFCENNYPKADFKFVFNENYKKTNNMYGLYLTREFLNGEVFIMNGDVIFSDKIISGMLAVRDSLIATDTSQYLRESMKIKVDNEGFISDISKEIKKNESYGCSIDVYKFNKNDLKIIKKELNEIIEEEKELNLWTEVLLQRLFLKKKIQVKFFNIQNKKWWEIDDFNDLNEAEKIFNKKLKGIKKRKLFLIDGDGTLMLGNKIIEKADDFINHLNKKKIRFCILSNNSSKTKREHYNRLISAGFNIKEDNILLPIESLINHLIGKKIKNIYLLANKKVADYFISKGFNFDSQKPEAVVLTYDTEINYKKLVQATLLIQKGLPYFATHTDNLCPAKEGFVPDIGTFIKVLEMSTGRVPDRTFGKPSKELIIPTLKKYHLTPKDCIIIGDRLYTDIKMANDLGILSVLVLSGATKREDVEFSKTKPDIIVQDINQLILFI